MQTRDEHFQNANFSVNILKNGVVSENTEQGLHACDTAADRSLTPEQNWQWDEFLARNKIQLEHNKLQQLEELLLYLLGLEMDLLSKLGQGMLSF